MRAPQWCLVWLTVFAALAGAAGETPTERLARVEQENAALRVRVQALETALSDIKQMLGQRPGAPAGAPSAAATKPDPRPAVRSKFEVDFSGYVKLDAAYDTQRGQNGNLYYYAEARGASGSDDTLSVTARQSRLTMNVKTPDVAGAKAGARIEVDFYGDSPENKNAFRMRHGYFEMVWPKLDLGLLAGQTYDIVSPLNVPTQNFAVGNYHGNVGYRRPQLRVTKGFAVGRGTRLETQFGVARNIGRSTPQTTFAPASDTGGDAGIPDVQGRVGVRLAGLGGRATDVGVSGMWGEEQWHAAAGDRGTRADKWLMNLDATVPLNRWATISGEIWMGANLHTYMGGINQGVNTNLGFRAIRATGGWANLALTPLKRTRFNLGYGLDDPRDEDLNAGDRTRNRAVWGNAQWEAVRDVTVGLELMHFRTDYKGRAAGNNLRCQVSLQYSF